MRHCTLHLSGENGKRIRELTRIVQKRFGFDENTVELYADRVAQRGLCAQAQAETLKYVLCALGGELTLALLFTLRVCCVWSLCVSG